MKRKLLKVLAWILIFWYLFLMFGAGIYILNFLFGWRRLETEFFEIIILLVLIHWLLNWLKKR